LRRIALKALEGVGDEALGQWEEWTGKAFHIRRRLSNEEQLLTGDAIDIRGTSEAIRRVYELPTQTLAMLPAELLNAEL
jgi:hypothetical protein